MNLHLHDRVSYQGLDFEVAGVLDYRLADRGLRLACLHGAGQTRFLEPPSSESADRVLFLTEIGNLDITPPPPQTLYHRGDSYLLRLSGAAEVEVAGRADGRRAGPCALWRYRAAGDQFLQIEAWPDKMRTLAGPSVHRSMLEIRPQQTR